MVVRILPRIISGKITADSSDPWYAVSVPKEETVMSIRAVCGRVDFQVPEYRSMQSLSPDEADELAALFHDQADKARKQQKKEL